MKRIGLLFSVLVLAFVFAQAQPGNFNPEEMMERQVEEITEACDLSKAQVKEVKAILEKTHEKRKAMFEENRGGGGDREAMREKMDELRETETKEIKAILEENQVKKYEAYLKKQKERMKDFGGGPGRR